MKDAIVSGLQKLGKALMGAVAVMPVAAILMGIGYWIDPTGWGADNVVASILINSGSAILDNLGWIFAIALSFGLAKDSNGAAVLSGFIGYATVTKLIGPDTVASYKGIDPDSLSGDAAVDWAAQGWAAINDKNVFIGILVGILAAWCYNRFHTTTLPDFLAFFSGRRLVPILTALLSIALAGVLYLLWPILYSGLFNFGQWIQSMGALGAGIYGFINRLLIPTGLHHALNSIFWFDVVGINDIGKFLAGGSTIADATQATSAATCPGIWDQTTRTCEVTGYIGRYQAGFFPIMMFGLPGAALAIYLRSTPARRKVVGSLMFAGALASFFTGVTEPLEFSFMFVAPLLYVVHALLTGLSMFIAASLHWTAGFGFSAGLVDMLLSGRNPLAHQWWMLIILGLIYSVVYFVVFYYLIGIFKLRTPGREEESEDNDAQETITSDAPTSDIARRIIAGLGGAENITNFDHCATRLRVTVSDYLKVNEKEIKKAGVAGIIRPSQKAVQIVIGPQVQTIYDEAQRQLTTTTDQPSNLPALTLLSPFDGTAIPLSEVADEVFAKEIAGVGVAVQPSTQQDSLIVHAPLAGRISTILKTKHALAIQGEENLSVLIHFGLETVKLGGEGFELLVEKGQEVQAGQPLLRVDIALLRKHNIDLTTPIVISEKKAISTIEGNYGVVHTGDHIAKAHTHSIAR
ncbi:PTS N-acetylmuramic acid transporter subunit IIBC [Corynebacterium sp. sy017]|uniref:N-acetylglucosamine-specific PTS transporter subunit IIBC n=1 Tax=unclassified Corynebacterium TaxID=2624378 RepID=UPI0011857313|nr:MULTISPECIES: N-acetylglucosamine-specific PTS transporter subunit IIBC [unclassified Corynebacterium]MBP3089289.1 PTS N-acetylmuramic acid transporter subunit IIBC [Corynebacterium sp. sy017]TSD91007.1 PTS N-acetylmuramic acid transporter subunit IIBC [Corynebacterium sp. SY003]